MSKSLDEAIRLCDASNDDKDKNFREFYKKLRKVAENGTFEDLVAVRKEMKQVYESGGFKKSDYAVLQKNDLEAERYAVKRLRQKR